MIPAYAAPLSENHIHKSRLKRFQAALSFARKKQKDRVSRDPKRGDSVSFIFHEFEGCVRQNRNAFRFFWKDVFACIRASACIGRFFVSVALLFISIISPGQVSQKSSS